MKKNYLLILMIASVFGVFATTHTVSNSGPTFSPDSLTIDVGDSINFNIASSHNIKQYEEKFFDNGSTYSSSNVTNSGFSMPFGGGVLGHILFYIPGTYYYVCEPHFDSGMKAKIVVSNAAPNPACSELFFSQYMEGSASNKALEIYNPSSSSIDLSNYTLVMYNNGGNAVNTLALTGSIAANSTYVIAKSGASVAGIADLVNGIINHNGDDAYALVKNGVGAVDIIGFFDYDPGSQFNVTGGDTKDNTLTRMSSVNTGTTDWTLSATQWIVTSSNDTVGFGSHTMTPCVTGPVVSFKTDSFTFNEGDGAIHLDSLLINPAIVTPAGEQFEIHLGANSTADATDFSISAGVPVTLPYTHTISTPLFNFTALGIDATLVDDTLIEGTEYLQIILRNGVAGMNIGADSILYVTITDNDFAADTLVELNTMAITKNEADGSFDVTIDYLQSATNTLHTVDLQMITGDVADIDNYTTQTVTFDALSKSVTVNITDDAIVEGTETITFALVNPTNGLKIASDSIFTLTLEDNDIAISNIGDYNTNDTLGADSLGAHIKIVGIVNSMDRGYNSLEFSMQDATGAITIFTDAAAFIDKDPSVGDELEIEGDIVFFNGIVRLENLVSFDSLSAGNTVSEVVTLLPDDLNESSLIRINELTMIDPSQWLAAGGAGFTVEATNTVGDTVNIRIDRDYVSLYNSTAPISAKIDVIGVANQYDNSAPYNGNYQIIPRDLNDIILYPTVIMDEQGTTVQEDAGTITIDFTLHNTATGIATVDVELTNGDAVDVDDFTTVTAVDVSSGTGSITVTITDDTEVETNESFEFTLTNPSAGLLIGNANKFDLTIEDNDTDGINEINVNSLKVYPNPAKDKVSIEMLSNENQIALITLIDITGKTILSNTSMLNYGINNVTLDLSTVTNGNYQILISTENGEHSESLIVR